MTTARIAEQIVVTAPDKVGLLAEQTTALLGAGVDIVAITGYGRDGSGEIMIITDDNQRAVETLEKTGGSVRLERVVLMTMPDEVGALNEAAQRIAQAGIDIDWMYATSCESSHVTVVFSVADVEALAELF